MRNKASQFTGWNNEIAGVVSTAKIQTEPFDAPQIARNLAADDFDFREIKRTPVTVYLVLPPHMMERQGKWLRLVLTSALRAAMKPRRAGEPKILFMLDEFAALGHLKIVETVWAQVRGYAIQIMPVFQDLPQLISRLCPRRPPRSPAPAPGCRCAAATRRRTALPAPQAVAG